MTYMNYSTNEDNLVARHGGTLQMVIFVFHIRHKVQFGRHRSIEKLHTCLSYINQGPLSGPKVWHEIHGCIDLVLLVIGNPLGKAYRDIHLGGVRCKGMVIVEARKGLTLFLVINK